MKYSKAALPIADLLARWRAKGLHIPDTAAAERALTFVGRIYRQSLCVR